MKLKKYIVTFVFTLLCAVMLQSVETKAATTFEDVKVYVVEDMTNYDQTIGLSWKLDWSLDKDAGVEEQCRYGKFTLAEKSYVRIKLTTVDEKSFAANDYFRVYGNESMAVPIVENDIGYGSGDDYLLLEAGIYYIECGAKTYMSGTSQHTTKVMIGAVAADKAIEVTQTASADRKKMTVTVTQKIADTLRTLKWGEGKTDGVSSYGYGTFDENNSFTVDKNGWYTIQLTTQSSVGFDQEITEIIHVNVTGIGAGAEKGVTYNSGNLKYKLVKAGFDGTGTVMVTGVVEQKSSITIPKTVKIGGHNYKVVKINKNAFKGKSKIKKITIKSTTITSIGKNAIKGINNKATIKVPKSKYKDYKKLFKSKTGYKKTMKIKK